MKDADAFGAHLCASRCSSVTGSPLRQTQWDGQMIGKILFAPLPPRAIGDPRLTGLHLRTLAAIALHDRMSCGRKYGQGCWAGNKTLAKECGCHYSNLFTAITELAKFGYIERRHHPLNKRQRVYRVIYNDTDREVIKPRHRLPMDKLSFAPPDQPICPEIENAQVNPGLNGDEYIPLKRENIPLKEEANSAEAVRFSDDEIDTVETDHSANGTVVSSDGANLGAQLSVLETALRNGKKIPDLEAWGDFLAQIYVNGDLHDPNVQLANDLLSEIEYRLRPSEPA